jgi:UNC-50 family
MHVYTVWMTHGSFLCFSLPTDVVQFFALPIALGEGWLPLLVANTMYALAFSWYWYITHLGYRALPFLSHTEVFLFPITAIVVLYLTTLIGYPFGFGWNMTRVMARFYFF